MSAKPIKIFYSYSHKDEKYREALDTHLSILKRKQIIDEWHDRKILAGSLWESEIDKNLQDADIILLLVSSDFIASDYCYKKEMEQALERHALKKSIVIPVILRPTDWSDAPFAKLQAIPKDAIPISKWENEDDAWLDVVQRLKKLINEVAKKASDLTNENIINQPISNRQNKIPEMLSFDKYTGTWVDDEFNLRYCASCKAKDINSPLQEKDSQWACPVCGKRFSAPREKQKQFSILPPGGSGWANL